MPSDGILAPTRPTGNSIDSIPVQASNLERSDFSRSPARFGTSSESVGNSADVYRAPGARAARATRSTRIARGKNNSIETNVEPAMIIINHSRSMY